jgi:hypothetical protein
VNADIVVGNAASGIDDPRWDIACADRKGYPNGAVENALAPSE